MWLVMGDFNEIMSSDEKQGKLLRCPTQMAEFREALNDCLLLDLGFQGYEFTWTNNRDPPECVDESWIEAWQLHNGWIYFLK
jgi:hypothetical protein